jgi:hypothetical protein
LSADRIGRKRRTLRGKATARACRRRVRR